MNSRLRPGKGGYLILLCALVALLVVRPIMAELTRMSWLLPLFITGVLLARVWAVARRRIQVLALAVIVLIVFADHWTRGAVATWMHEAISPLLSLVFFSWIAVILAVDALAMD